VAKAAEAVEVVAAEAAAAAAKSAAPAAASAAKRGKRAAASEAVQCARELYANGQISAEELETLIAKDTEFQVQIEESLKEDERFLVSAAFGESWAQKKRRIQAESPEGQRPGWDLVGMIVKSNDDLRQEVCALQLIELSRQLFVRAELPLFLRSYTIISTDASTGLIEILTDAISIDALKKRQIQRLQEATDHSAYAPSGVGLAHHFESTYGPADSPRGHEARRRFASSLAAYSAVAYAFAIKDRHNGNILLDTDGHLIHIDFGFLLGIAPGGAFSIETAPFKLTDETVQVLGDVSSKLFADFVLLFSCAFLALQAGVDQIAGVVDIMCDESPFPCFAGVAKADVLAKLKQRLRPDLDRRASVGFAIDLIRQSMGSTLTRQYDNFQWLTNGIMP
jgi:phosphatidylinositol 4-kinase